MISGLPPSTSRYLVTGATGTVGHELALALRAAGHAVAGTGRREAEAGVPWPHFKWDVGDAEIPAGLRDWRAHYVIHAAAMIDVDYCEDHPEEARQVNVRGTAHVAELARQWGARLVYLSTDSVFDGRTGRYADDAPINPLNVYAMTKAQGEAEALRLPGALVVRFNVVSPGRLTRWILDSAASGKAIEVFEDVRFNPVEVLDLASLISVLASAPIDGICHAGSDEAVSKAEYAERLARYAGLNTTQMRRVRLADRPMRAPRPLDTSLRISGRVASLRPAPSLDAAIRRLAHGYGAPGAHSLPARTDV